MEGLNGKLVRTKDRISELEHRLKKSSQGNSKTDKRQYNTYKFRLKITVYICQKGHPRRRGRPRARVGTGKHAPRGVQVEVLSLTPQETSLFPNSATRAGGL